ncbi:MAG: Rpn family recombination-promoting nuclease/putative transposase [Ruminococcus sp.]|jgi:predicted transposase/invertase (TIGR01784 family)|nr:Rpn family recombination-promoting nuclease/putative transposase [Ruminococcus sp.]
MIYERIEELPELLPFKDDYIFKTMLTREGAEIVRNSILSAFTGLEIVKSTVVENEPPIDFSPLEKQIRLDVHCVTDQNKEINIEMQANAMDGDSGLNQHENLRCRSIYYVGKLFAGQNAERYSEMNQTFQIMVCGFPVFDDENLIHKFCYTDGKHILSDICTIIYVELPKIQKLIGEDFAGLSRDKQWALFIENIDKKDFAQKVLKHTSKEEFRVAVNTLSGISKNREEQIRYLSRLKFQKDLIHSRSVAVEEGVIKGREQGIEQGKREAVIETAKNALAMGFTIEQVVGITKLPQSEIENLINPQ